MKNWECYAIQTLMEGSCYSYTLEILDKGDRSDSKVKCYNKGKHWTQKVDSFH